MPELAVTAIGRDRPGIVAAISGALLELEGNIEDSQMSILGGHFAVMLLVRVPAETPTERVATTMEGVRAELDLEAVTVNEIADGGRARERATHVVSVYGADRRGIVHSVSSALASLGVNVTDLETRLAGGEGAPVYVMIVEVALGDATPETVESELRKAGGETGVEVSIRELGGDAL